MPIGPNRCGTFGANADTYIREQENYDTQFQYIGRYCTYKISDECILDFNKLYF